MGGDTLHPRAYAEAIIATVREPLLVLDAELRVRAANPAFYRNFAATPEATLGQRLPELGNGQWNIPRLRSLLADILRRDRIFEDFEVTHDFPGIGPGVMLLNGRRLREDGAELILLTIEDVTAQRRLEAEREALEVRFTSLVKNIRDHSIFTLDPAGRVTSWNVAAERILGYTEAEVLGRYFGFIFSPGDQAGGVPEAELCAARAHGRAEDERWHLRKGGARFWALGIVSAMHDASGRLTGFAKILRDMTAWKLADQARQSSEERLRQMLDIETVGVLVFDGSGTLIDANEPFLRMSGRSRGEITARSLTWRLMTPPEHMAESERRMRQLAETGRIGPYEKECLRGDGSRSWMLFAGARLADGSLVEYCIDVDDRRRAEAALRRSEARYRSLFESIDEGFCIVDMIFADGDRPVDYRFLEINPAGEQLTGLVAVEGRRARELLPELEADWAGIFGHVALTGESRRFQNYCAPLDRWFDVYAWRHGDPADRQVAVLFSDISARRQAEAALEQLNRTLEARIAERTRQLRALANQLTETERRERTRLAQVLHDHLQQLLVAARMQLATLARGADPFQHKRAVAEAMAILQDALEASRSLAVELSPPVLAQAGLVGALEWLGARMQSQHGLSIQLQADTAAEPASDDLRFLLFECVRELLLNVAKHAGVGVVGVALVRHVDPEIMVMVTDEGVGFDPEVLAARHADATSFGLFSIQQRLAHLGGSVTIESAPGRGTRVTLVVPSPRVSPAVVAAADPAAGEGALRVSRPPGRCRLLIVDDHQLVREGLVRLCEFESDIEVVGQAGDATAAIAAVETLQPDVVLMDVNLGAIDGIEATRQICARQPATRVIGLSMYPDAAVAAAMHRAGAVGYLTKGGSPEDLLIAIRACAG